VSSYDGSGRYVTTSASRRRDDAKDDSVSPRLQEVPMVAKNEISRGERHVDAVRLARSTPPVEVEVLVVGAGPSGLATPTMTRPPRRLARNGGGGCRRVLDRVYGREAVAKEVAASAAVAVAG
jgi:hypothetical protein